MQPVSANSGSVPINYEQYLGPLFFEPYAVDLASHLTAGADNILEMACGTGRLTRHLLSKLNPGGRLLATDLNPGMIAVTQSVITDPRISWKVADAMQLPFDDQSFEWVVCQFGFMFFPDKEKAFAEAFRVLRKSGHLLFNTWDGVQHNTVSCLAQETMDELYGSEAPEFSEKGPYSFPDPALATLLLKKAGFSHIEVELVAKEHASIDTEGAARGIIDGSPLTKYIAEGPVPPEKVKSRLKQKLEDHFQKNATGFRMQAWVLTAGK